MNDKLIQLFTTVILSLLTVVLVPTTSFVFELDKRIALVEYKVEELKK